MSEVREGTRMTGNYGLQGSEQKQGGIRDELKDMAKGAAADFVANLLERGGGPAPGSRLAEVIARKVTEVGSYEPVVAIYGKSGVGKSSLCNALFGKHVALVSYVESCTRTPQEVAADLFGAKIKLIDFPGVGENPARDEEYRALYKQRLPEIDLILW